MTIYPTCSSLKTTCSFSSLLFWNGVFEIDFLPHERRKEKKKGKNTALCSCSSKEKENFSSLSLPFSLFSSLSLSLIKVKIPSNERRRRSLESKSRSSWTPIAVQSRLHFRERLGERARRWDKLVRFLLCLFVFFFLLLLSR